MILSKFAKSGMMAKRMPQIRTDCDSPSARPLPPQAEKIRFYPWHQWHPFCHHAALVELIRVRAAIVVALV